MRASAASLVGWGRTTDRRARAQNGQQGLLAKFAREVDEELDPEGQMDPQDKARIVETRYRAHFRALAYQKAKKKHLQALAVQEAGPSVAADEPADETPQDPSTDKEEGSR